jgi:hypothetical protein
MEQVGSFSVNVIMKQEPHWGITYKARTGRTIMAMLLPILLTASHVALAGDAVPKFDVARTCQPAARAAILPGRDSSACQRDESDARSKLGQD